MESDDKHLKEEDYALMILKNRLAKGEITVKEFDELKEKLVETSSANDIKDEIRNISETMEKVQEKQSKNQNLQRKMKSESTTLVLAIILGLFGIQGIGHIYAGKVGKGVWILIGSLVLFVIGVATLFVGVGVIFLIIYFVIYIWQIIDSRKLCREYNDELEATGETPW
jgi:TM2 domain-containing membrane protein YozV